MSQSQATTANWKEVRKKAQAALPQEVVAKIAIIRARSPHPESELIGVLHAVQEAYGHLAPDHLDAVAQLLQVPAAKVSGVANFYHFFRLVPRGQYMISVCMGTACYVKGAEDVVERIRQELGIDFGESTEDGLFTLQASRCLGTCGLAPVVMINDDVHGKVTPEQVPALLRQYAEQG